MAAPFYPSKAVFLQNGIVPVTSSAGKVFKEQECSICQDDFKITENHHAVRLSCGHMFGNHCILEWVDTMGMANCPMCGVKLYEKTAARPVVEEHSTPINHQIRRALFTGGTLGTRVLRAKGPGLVLEKVAQHLAEDVPVEIAFKHYRARGAQRERTYARDKLVMTNARQDPDLQYQAGCVLFALSLAVDGVGTDDGWDVLQVVKVEENEPYVPGMY